MKPLDFVITPQGNLALVVETNEEGSQASVSFIGGGNPGGEKSSWWREGDGLKVVDSLPNLLGRNICHPFGSGRPDVKRFFPIG